jgi:hypothetical protein
VKAGLAVVDQPGETAEIRVGFNYSTLPVHFWTAAQQKARQRLADGLCHLNWEISERLARYWFPINFVPTKGPLKPKSVPPVGVVRLDVVGFLVFVCFWPDTRWGVAWFPPPFPFRPAAEASATSKKLPSTKAAPATATIPFLSMAFNSNDANCIGTEHMAPQHHWKWKKPASGSIRAGWVLGKVWSADILKFKSRLINFRRYSSLWELSDAQLSFLCAW